MKTWDSKKCIMNNSFPKTRVSTSLDHSGNSFEPEIELDDTLRSSLDKFRNICMQCILLEIDSEDT